MAIIAKPNTFVTATVADAGAVNADFDTIYNDYNGNITDANIANTGITTYGKVQGAAITSLGSLNAGAGTIPIANIPSIPNTSLATINTAGKVDGAALTGLANIPSGAGKAPVANLGTGTPSASNYLRGDGAWTTLPSTGMAFTDGGDVAAVSLDISAANLNGAWHDWDLSATIPSGASIVFLTIQYYKSTAGGYLYFRKKGNSNTFNVFATYNVVTGGTITAEGMVQLSAGRVVEYYGTAGGTSSANAVIKGWM